MDCHGTTFAHFTQKKDISMMENRVAVLVCLPQNDPHNNNIASCDEVEIKMSIRALIATFDDDFKVASNESTFPIGKISREKKIRSMKFIGNSNLIYFPGLHEIFVL